MTLYALHYLALPGLFGGLADTCATGFSVGGRAQIRATKARTKADASYFVVDSALRRQPVVRKGRMNSQIPKVSYLSCFSIMSTARVSHYFKPSGRNFREIGAGGQSMLWRRM